MTGSRWGRGPPYPSPQKKRKKYIVEVFSFRGDSNNLNFLKNINTFGPLAPSSSENQHLGRDTGEATQTIHAFGTPTSTLLYLSVSDFLIYHFRPHHCLVGSLFIFSSSLPLRLDRQLFMMFPCPRDFTLQI